MPGKVFIGEPFIPSSSLMNPLAVGLILWGFDAAPAWFRWRPARRPCLRIMPAIFRSSPALSGRWTQSRFGCSLPSGVTATGSRMIRAGASFAICPEKSSWRSVTVPSGFPFSSLIGGHTKQRFTSFLLSLVNGANILSRGDLLPWLGFSRSPVCPLWSVFFCWIPSINGYFFNLSFIHAGRDNDLIRHALSLS
jgi:hypothetical protein